MKKEMLAVVLILLSFSTGMVLTAATSGCDAHPRDAVQAHAAAPTAALADELGGLPVATQ